MIVPSVKLSKLSQARSLIKFVRNRPASADPQVSEAIREMQTEVSTRQVNMPHAASSGQRKHVKNVLTILKLVITI